MTEQGNAVEKVKRFPPVVGLNVGGKIFATKLETLRKYPGSMLADMFSGDHNIDIDKGGNYFIDRNGKYFDHILDFLRNDSHLPPKDIALEVLDDANYYGLSKFVEKLKNSPPLWPVISRIEEGRRGALEYDNLKGRIIFFAKSQISNTFGIECDTDVHLIQYSAAPFSEERHPKHITCPSFDHVKLRWSGGANFRYVIDLDTTKIMWFKYAMRSLLYDIRQEGYDVKISIKEGPADEYFCRADNTIYIDENSAVFTFHWNSTWPYRDTGLPNTFN